MIIYSKISFYFQTKLYILIILSLCIFFCCSGCSTLINTISIQKQYKVGDILKTSTDEIITFDDMINELMNTSIIYIGEHHSNIYHHQKQLEIIKAMVKQNCDLIISMEMFDYTYQNIIDLWVYKNLTEEKFLRLSHWYANWRFNFDLYKNILNYIKINKIRTIGLNLPFHIPPKIATGGIASLNEKDRKHLPKRIDLSYKAHRNYIMNIHKKNHKNILGRKNFDSFYQAQCVWEDFMAQNIAKNMISDKMIVLVGNGHVINKYSIPYRVQSKIKISSKIIYLSVVGNNSDFCCTADYILFTSPILLANK